MESQVRVNTLNLFKKWILLLLLVFTCSACVPSSYSEYYILEMEQNKVTLAPWDYDGDAKESFKDKIVVKELADRVTYKEISIYTTVKNERRKSKIKKKRITRKDIETAVEYDSAYVRVTFDKEDRINSMTLWGELIIYE